jgi:triosephosphate isomerase (TIM)
VLVRVHDIACKHRVFRNDDKAINRKVRAVLDHDMRPILCVGESKEEYDAGLVKAVSTHTTWLHLSCVLHLVFVLL